MGTFTFKDQVKYFEKKLNLPTDSYLDVLGEEHNYFFMVAGANRNEVLLAFREAVDAAIGKGETLEGFRKRFDEIVAKTGWDYNGGRNWRSRIIYDTNLYGAYNQGRLKQHLDLADEMPYWEYKHNDNAHPRQQHVALDGTIRPANDPFWQYYYPIKAYGCHCTVVAYDEDDLKAMGKTISPPVEVEYEDKLVGVRTGNPRMVSVPKGYDVGFAPHDFTNISSGRLASVDKMLMQKLVTADPIFAARCVDDLLQQQAIMELHSDSFRTWVNGSAQSRGDVLRTIENVKLVGALSPEILDVLAKKNLMPSSAIIAMEKGNVLHALRDIKKKANIIVPLNFWEDLPRKLRKPMAILLEHRQVTPTLLYIYKEGSNKIAIKMGYELKLADRITKKSKRTHLNKIVTGSLINKQEWEEFNKGTYELLWGEL